MAKGHLALVLGTGSRTKGKLVSKKNIVFYFCLIKNAVDAPPPNTYTLKTCFDGESPTIRKNHLTTTFKNQSSRDAQGIIMRSPKNVKPGPGQYEYKNLTIGTDALKFTLKSRIKNLRGKYCLASNYTVEPEEVAKRQMVPGPGHYKTIGIDA